MATNLRQPFLWDAFRQQPVQEPNSPVTKDIHHRWCSKCSRGHAVASCRFRELGCTSTAVRVQMPSEGPGSQDVVNTTSYNIALLKGGDKNLAQSFPRPKVMKKQGAR